MKKPIILTVLGGLILVGAAFGQQKKLVGNIGYKPGAACADFFMFAGQSPDSPELMFYSSLGDETDNWMNIDGKDVRLKFISRTEPTKINAEGAEIVGSRTTEKYIARHITVEIILTVNQVCAVDDPGCESIGYKAIFKIRKGNRRQIVKAEGVSGC